MKIFKIITLGIAGLILTAYLAFLFILPNAVNLDTYAPQIKKLIQDSTGFQVDIKGLKVKTAWNLSAGALIKKTDLKYPTGEKFAQINNLDIKLSLIPLFFNDIKLDSINAEKALFNLKMKKNGDFLMSDFIRTKDKKAVQIKDKTFRIKFSDKMPNIAITKYRASFIDISNGRIYSVKGKDLKISDFVLNKKIKINTIGNVILNQKTQIKYDLAIASKYFPTFSKSNDKNNSINIIKVFEDLHKYDLCANITSDIKINKDKNIDGKIDIENITFALGDKKLPQSRLYLDFKGDKVIINSDFYTDKNEKAEISGLLKNGKKRYINLKVASKKADIGNTLLIANTFLQSIGNKSLSGVSASGKLNADFVVKSDFKTVQSSGFLKISNANITDRIYKVGLNEIYADIDFSENSINIVQSMAKINGEPITIKGSIDKNANANLAIKANNIQLKGLIAALGKKQLLKENEIQSGTASIDALIKGRLDKTTPILNIETKNITLKNKKNNLGIKLNNAKIKLRPKNKKTNGNIEISQAKITTQSAIKTITLPQISVNFNGKDLTIPKTQALINNSKLTLWGEIKDFQSNKIRYNLTALGLLKASDIKSMLPKQNQVGVAASGNLPILIKITGGKDIDIQAQILANQHNKVIVFDINTLHGKTSLINANLKLNDNNLQINDISVYALKANKGLSSNMNSNTSSGAKVVSMNGKITDINKIAKFERVNINIPNKITSSIPGFEGSSINTKGTLTLNGNINAPQIGGYLTVSSVSIPTAKLYMKNLILHINKNTISANCKQTSFANSTISFNAELLNNFSNGVIIKNIDLTTNLIDLNTISPILAGLKNKNGPQQNIIILNGKSSSEKFKVGGILANNITSNLAMSGNILKIKNMRGDAYSGKIAGDIFFNIRNNLVTINMQGRGMSAGPAILAIINKREDIAGKLDIDTKISFITSSVPQILRTLNGSTNFIISNGKMGTLGKLEHLMYAQNVLSSNFFNTSLNIILKAVTVKNTGYYKYVKGKLTFGGGWANIKMIKAAGPSMSLYITGRYGLQENIANLIILGRLSDEVVKNLGPFGDLSMNKIISYIPGVGTITNAIINQMTTPPSAENTSMIPPLEPRTELHTREFKVVINGEAEKQNSVKYFKWLSTPKASDSAPKTISAQQVGQTIKSVGQKVQEGAKDAWNQVAPVKPNQTYYKLQPNQPQTSTPRPYQPKQKPTTPDFINSLPNLKN